ncbi:hypothetical protein BM1_09038 [Bipolaris maydis]|nr:hypothetical protein BM1_09038 [Bipolaris maydis]KAJ5024221.1 hypothetical protein J3E73DRAFT_372145 [Bipolaris maydis]
MHFVTALAVLATIVTMASAIKVALYEDGYCFIPKVVYNRRGNGRCYNTDYELNKSASITTCEDNRGCGCYVYEFENCRGRKAEINIQGENCAWIMKAKGFGSFRCFNY